MSKQGADDTTRQAIDLLIEEYRSLRGEATQRFLSPPVFVLALGGIAALLAAAAKEGAAAWLVGALLAVAGVLLLFSFVLWRNGNHWAMHAATQLFEIELRVNQLARDAGIATKPLLTWETKMASEREGMKKLKRKTKRCLGLYIPPKVVEKHREQRADGQRTLRRLIPPDVDPLVFELVFKDAFKAERSKASWRLMAVMLAVLAVGRAARVRGCDNYSTHN